MKLAFKIVAICLLAMVLITALASFLIARREFERARETQQADAMRLGNLIRESVNLVYQRAGHQGIVQAIKTQTVETGRVRYRWVWFDVAENDPDHPAASLDSLDQILHDPNNQVFSTADGINHLNTYYPLDVRDESGKTRKGAIEVSGSLETAQREAWRTIKTGLLAIAAMTLFCFAIVSWAGVKFIGNPLTKLIERTRQIGEGDYLGTVDGVTHDEFGELAIALHRMGEKISQQQEHIRQETAGRVAAIEQLRHADRLKTVGRLAAGLAHEIGTPLNVVSGRAGLIRSGKLRQDEIADSALTIQNEANRIAEIVRQLLDFARQNPPKRVALDLSLIVKRVISLLQPIAAKHHVKLEYRGYPSVDQGLVAMVDESQLQQVVINLLMNAIQAMPDGGVVELKLKREPAAVAGNHAGDGIQISITDQGSGMNAETQQQIFEPFFTTKEAGQGTGLGLSIAQGIIEEHGGSIQVESQPQVGTTFHVWLPARLT